MTRTCPRQGLAEPSRPGIQPPLVAGCPTRAPSPAEVMEWSSPRQDLGVWKPRESSPREGELAWTFPEQNSGGTPLAHTSSPSPSKRPPCLEKRRPKQICTLGSFSNGFLSIAYAY